MRSAKARGARILLVEDDPAHALLMRETLELLGGRSVAQELGTSVRTRQRRLKELGLRREDSRGLGE